MQSLQRDVCLLLLENSKLMYIVAIKTRYTMSSGSQNFNLQIANVALMHLLTCNGFLVPTLTSYTKIIHWWTKKHKYQFALKINRTSLVSYFFINIYKQFILINKIAGIPAPILDFQYLIYYFYIIHFKFFIITLLSTLQT